MPDIPPPTEADLARSASEDYAIAEAATPGPFHAGYREVANWDLVQEQPDVLVSWSPNDDEGYSPEQIDADGKAFALSRTALPAWIRRHEALKAELAAERERNKAMEVRVRELEHYKQKAIGASAALYVERERNVPLEARIKELEEALRPFAKAEDFYKGEYFRKAKEVLGE